MAAGRPSKYKPEFIEQAKKLCLLGATDMEIADFLEVNIVTLYRWKNEHEEFCNALKISKAVADDRV
jgi:transposase-like protein